MTFTSITFALFLPIVFALYWSSQRVGVQNAVLVASGFTFYGWWDYRFCALLLFTSLLDFLIGRLLDAIGSDQRRRQLLIASVATNIGVLAAFKYLDFFAEQVRRIAHDFGTDVSPFTLNVIIPVGLSFYTFQSLGYVFDVYRRRIKPVRNVIDFLAFISFFPQLVAGPIERAQNLLSQISSKRNFDLARATDGARQILWGAIKKTIVADNLAPIVEAVYEDPSANSGPQLMLATVCFAIQIYCDFSGYSDIAVGCARLFGIELTRNFAYPYFSTSLTEFWRRWHISLSTWFRDYVYVPLGGDRRGGANHAANILITFALSGLWHGAAWHYIAWGVLNGCGVAIEKVLARRTNAGGQRRRSWAATVARQAAFGVATFSFICIGWVLFRAASLPQAYDILSRITVDAGSVVAWTASGKTAVEHAQPLIAAVACLALEWLARKHTHPLAFVSVPWRLGAHLQPAFRWSVYTLIIIAILQYAPFRGREFIYFQF